MPPKRQGGALIFMDLLEELAVRNLEPVEIQSLWKMKMVSLSATQEPFLWIRTPFAVFYMSSSRPHNPANPCSYFLQSCRSSVRQRQTKWENSFDLGKWSHGDRGNLFWLYCTKWWTNFNSSGSAAVSCVGSIALILIKIKFQSRLGIRMVVLLTFHFSKLCSKFSKEFLLLRREKSSENMVDFWGKLYLLPC